MKQNRNKLNSGKKKKSIICVGIVFFVLIFALAMFCCYIFMCYLNDNGITASQFSTNDMLSLMGYLNSPSFSVAFTWATFLQLLRYQLDLWYVYALFFLIVFLSVTTRKDNDYRGVEKGGADWEDKSALKDFADKTGIPIGNNFYCTVNNPNKQFYSTHNLNEVVIGGSGAGKSFRKIKPDIIQMYGSYVVTDPKGELYRDTCKLLTENGYKVRVLNLIDIKYSNTYNPFVYMLEEQDVLSVADLFIQNTSGEGEKQDFWSGSAKDLLVAIMMYLWKSEGEVKCFGRVIRLVNSIRYKDGVIDPLCELSRCLNKHKTEHPTDAVGILWDGFAGTPEQTMGGIAKTLSTRLGLWAIADVDELTAADEMDFDNIGLEKTAVFLIIPPARNTYRAVVNIFYSQLFERLMYVANFKCGGRLPNLVSCELDEFANIGRIPNFNETLSVVRSCNMRICIVLQGLAQLKALYEKTWESILGNCSIFTFLGTNDLDSKKYVVERLGKTTVRTDTRSYNKSYTGGGSTDNESYESRDLCTVDELPRILKPKGKSKRYGGHCIAFIDEYRPFYLLKYDTLRHPLIGTVGSSFEKDAVNNTDIAKQYEDLHDKRAEKHKSELEAALEKANEEALAAEQEQEQADAQEQAALAAQFESDFEEAEAAPPDNPEPEDGAVSDADLEIEAEEISSEDIEAFF